MSKHFQRDLENIHTQVLSMFGVVEKMIDDSVRAFCDQRIELASEVIATDEKVNAFDVAIEEECLKVLALHQPVARSLRRVTTMLKINSDLERIADLACNIAERALAMQETPYFPIPDQLTTMADDAIEMVRKALNSFVDLNVELAKEVILIDTKVDEANREVIHELRELMVSEPNQVAPALHCFSASRHLERIGDLAENIAEDVIYMVAGDIIRHQHRSFIEKPHEEF